MKVSKKAYLHVFTIIVLALGLLRLTTDIDEPKSPEEIAMADSLAVVNEEAEAEEKSGIFPHFSPTRHAKASQDLQRARLRQGFP